MTCQSVLPITFDYQPRTRIVFGNDSVTRLGELACELGGQRALLVTDPGISATCHVGRARRSLEAAGIVIAVYDRVRENPTTRDVDACLAVAKAAEVDLIVGFGGGSSLDTAKGCNFLLTNGGRIADYWGVGKATKPLLPMIAVPTTAGTGSECQSFALIADEQTHQKMACGDPKAAPAVALLDPALTLTQPRQVTACTGVDALAHAVESFVSTRRTPLSMIYSREAFRLIVGNLSLVLEDPDDLIARGATLLGASLAGVAIENSMLGAAHAAANPLTAHYGLPHGQAVAHVLPHVIRFNARQADVCNAYAELARDARLSDSGDDWVALRSLIQAIEKLIEAGGLHWTLAACEAHKREIGMLAEEAAGQWTANFNPREATACEFADLYTVAWPAG